MQQIIARVTDSETRQILKCADHITEIRLRNGRPLQIRFLNGSEHKGEILSKETIECIITELMDKSLYSRERELQHGYFTTAEGCRVGVCGKVNAENGRIQSFADINSVCIRIPHEAVGCANEVIKVITNGGLKGLLLISPPGMGKTTMLRDIARQLSSKGYNIAIADERREIAVCREGNAQMDVGTRTDIMDGCPKAIAIPLLVRACAPDVVISDEIGTPADAEALLDAVRCGVCVIASAHGRSLQDVKKRKSIAAALRGHAFEYCAVLGPVPGRIKYMCKCTEEEPEYAEGNSVINRSAVLRRNWTGDEQCAQKTDGCNC